jgi:hypothetical protein
MSPVLLLGIGLIAISAVFFAMAAMYYQTYLDLRLKYSQGGYEECLHCGWSTELAISNMNSSLFFGILLLAGGASALTYGIYARKRRAQQSRAETSS